NQDAVNRFLNQGYYSKEKLLVVRDVNGLDHIECRKLTRTENILNRLGLSRLGFLFGYGNANLHEVLKKCPQCGINDMRLRSVVKNYNRKNPLNKILIQKHPWLAGLSSNCFTACERGDLQALKSLYSSHMDLNIQDAYGK